MPSARLHVLIAIMGYMLIAITAALSVAAFRYWIRVLAPKARPGDIADLPAMTGYWIDLVTLVLPRRPRRVWMAMLTCVLVLGLGLPHHLVLWASFQPEASSPWLYTYYLLSLAYWLALLALPAKIFVDHRLVLRQEAEATPSP